MSQITVPQWKDRALTAEAAVLSRDAEIASLKAELLQARQEQLDTANEIEQLIEIANELKNRVPQDDSTAKVRSCHATCLQMQAESKV